MWTAFSVLIRGWSKDAQLLETCSYDVALELAHLGAKMHPRSIELAKRYHVKVRIASSSNDRMPRNPAFRARRGKGDPSGRNSIGGIATKEGFHFFRAAVSLERLLPALREKRVALRFFNFSGDEIRFLCETEKVPLVHSLLRELGAEWDETTKVSIVSAVGDGLSVSTDVLPRFLEAIEEAKAPCLLLCSNALSMTAAVPTECKAAVTQSVHRRLMDA